MGFTVTTGKLDAEECKKAFEDFGVSEFHFDYKSVDGGKQHVFTVKTVGQAQMVNIALQTIGVASNIEEIETPTSPGISPTELFLEGKMQDTRRLVQTPG